MKIFNTLSAQKRLVILGMILSSVLVVPAIGNISAFAKILLACAFIICWLTIGAVLIINFILYTREMNALYLGVKKLSEGQFGYKLKDTDVSREAKELYKAFNIMSDRLQNYSESSVDSLMLEKNKFEAILMSIANGVIVCDSSDTVCLANEHAKQLLDVSDDEIQKVLDAASNEDMSEEDFDRLVDEFILKNRS